MAKINLTIVDRIVNIKELVPQKGNILQMIVSKSILEKTELTPLEIGEYGLEMIPDSNGKHRLNYKKIPPILSVEFEEAEMSLLKEGITNMDKEGKITLQNLKLCQDIMEFKVETTK